MPRSVPAFLLALSILFQAASAVLFPGAASAAGAQTLDGWGALKFGMSPDTARAVPGFDFGRYSRKNILDKNDGAMASKHPVPVYGVPYTLDLRFGAFELLLDITLQNEKTGTLPGCESAFLSLLSQLEKIHGGFSPIYRQQKKNDQDQLPMSVEWKNASASSRYQLVTAFLGGETAYVWNARKLFGDSYVDAAAIWSAAHDDEQAVCLTQIEYKR